MMQDHQKSGVSSSQDLFDLFEQGNDIDFETAYQMLSGTLEESEPLQFMHKGPRQQEVSTPIANILPPLDPIKPATPNVMSNTTPYEYANTNLIKTPHDNNILFSPDNHTKSMFSLDGHTTNHGISNNQKSNHNFDGIRSKHTGFEGSVLPHFYESKLTSPQRLLTESPHLPTISQNFLTRSPIFTYQPFENHQNIGIPPMIQEKLHNNFGFPQKGLDDHFKSPELLSSYESHAIENFLDNLVASDPFHNDKNDIDIKIGNDKAAVHEDMNNKGNILSAEIINNNKCNSSIDVTQNRINSTLHKNSNSSDIVHNREDYKNTDLTTNHKIKKIPVPKDYPTKNIELPGIVISDDDIPADIRHDMAKVRKWKHVRLEKLRRTHSKNAFDDLIKLIETPHPNLDKRIPKYKLLGLVMNDIKGLLEANEKLEKLLNS